MSLIGKRLVSGIQPTSNIHIGNYIGAISQWKLYQHQFKSFISIADLHAMTSGNNQKNRINPIQTAAQLIACGIDLDKTILFRQSEIEPILKLYWRICCETSTSCLLGMSHLKAKISSSSFASIGLLSYPVLMAADILSLKADVVPVGGDQIQHLEFTRKLARKMNSEFEGEIFPIPEAIHGKFPKIMSLSDSSVKMSKSSPNSIGVIFVFEPEEQIKAKIKRAQTDTSGIIEWNPKLKPQIANLLNIYSACSGENVDKVVGKYSGAKNVYSNFKEDLSKEVINYFQPIREGYAKVNLCELQQRLLANEEKVRQEVKKTLQQLESTSISFAQ
jgi:tryptophanyl-tRNA synthetase